MPQCGNVWGGFFNSTDDRPAPFWREKVAGTDTFTHCEFGATQGKFDLAACAKKNGLDAIHDTVHEMARDEARHGKALQGLLNRYFAAEIAKEKVKGAAEKAADKVGNAVSSVVEKIKNM